MYVYTHTFTGDFSGTQSGNRPYMDTCTYMHTYICTQVISRGPKGEISGVLKIVDDMAKVQHDVFEEPTVLLAKSVGLLIYIHTYVHTYIHTCTDDVFDQPTLLLAKSVGLLIYIHT
jgi:hypothetical protein